ncbi:MAG: MlaE family lipid ABC transporter permease subunit [Candidatus Cloacimonetes bacterium]|nr:MlaE family lipid ABC transporter permease subunit [Candidatus Cloacimonadota bacterium]
MDCEIERNGADLYLTGVIDKHSAPELLAQTILLEDISSIKRVDISGVSSIDSAGVALLDELVDRIKNQQGLAEITGATGIVARTVETFSQIIGDLSQPQKPPAFFEKIGESALEMKKSLYDYILLSSEITYWSIRGIFSKKAARKGSFIQQALLIGADALPIVSLLSFIIGLILALQAAAQLKQFGANIFVADLLSISMVREMGPMMTAIIVAGRSGSSIASEIATMKVTEELDALRMMSINPIRYVVVPKFLAMSLCLPLLVTLSIVVGIFGGLIIGITYLDLSAYSFINQCILANKASYIFISMAKSMFFAWVIVIIGSYFGFAVTGGAEGVGKATTSSVVASIFAVIVLDVIFSLLYMV